MCRVTKSTIIFPFLKGNNNHPSIITVHSCCFRGEMQCMAVSIQSFCVRSVDACFSSPPNSPFRGVRSRRILWRQKKLEQHASVFCGEIHNVIHTWPVWEHSRFQCKAHYVGFIFLMVVKYARPDLPLPSSDFFGGTTLSVTSAENWSDTGVNRDLCELRSTGGLAL